MELTGKNVLIFIGPDYEDRELFYPYYRFLEAGATVKIGGLGEKTYKGKYGVPMNVDGNCEDFVSQKWDAVVVPGGWAPDKIRANKAALEIVKKTVSQGAVVGAICHGGWVLASADVVRGKKVTSYKNISDDLIHAGAKWVDEEVVVDGGLVTSRTPADLPAFCREMVNAMKLAKVGA
ncbi:MAG TPA: type 1 glutamine amidotransferase domain-containing protein [Drouetiella sp.]